MNKKAEITVIDSVMGSGKTSWAIDYINYHPDENIVYIAPYIDETERIKQAVHRDVKTPAVKDKTFKLGNLLTLLQNEEDVASTHKLFSMLTDKHKEAIECGEYTLFIDETLEAVSLYETAKKDDIQYLLDKGSITIDEGGLIRWIDKDDYDTRFSDIRYDVKYVKRIDGKYQMVDYYEPSRAEFKEKIHIYKNADLNEIFPQKRTALSSTWFKTTFNKGKIAKLKNSIYNYLRHKCNRDRAILCGRFSKANVTLYRGKDIQNRLFLLDVGQQTTIRIGTTSYMPLIRFHTWQCNSFLRNTASPSTRTNMRCPNWFSGYSGVQ